MSAKLHQDFEESLETFLLASRCIHMHSTSTSLLLGQNLPKQPLRLLPLDAYLLTVRDLGSFACRSIIPLRRDLSAQGSEGSMFCAAILQERKDVLPASCVKR